MSKTRGSQILLRNWFSPRRPSKLNQNTLTSLLAQRLPFSAEDKIEAHNMTIQTGKPAPRRGDVIIFSAIHLPEDLQRGLASAMQELPEYLSLTGKIQRVDGLTIFIDFGGALTQMPLTEISIDLAVTGYECATTKRGRVFTPATDLNHMERYFKAKLIEKARQRAAFVGDDQALLDDIRDRDERRVAAFLKQFGR